MKRFASHRLYIPHSGKLLRNQVVEVEDGSGEVLDFYPFTEEISFTEWLGGLIVISSLEPSDVFDIRNVFHEIHVDENTQIRGVSSYCLEDTPLYAYHVTDFNVADMCFSAKSRMIRLY